MSSPFTAALQRQAQKASSVVEFVGWLFLVGIAIHLPEYHDWPQFLQQVRDFSLWNYMASPTAAVTFLKLKLPTLFLALVTIYSFRRYKNAAMTEIEMIEGMFDGDNAPKYIGNLVGAKYLPTLSYIIALAYMILVIGSSNPVIYAQIALVLHVADIVGNSLLLQNISKIVLRFAMQPDGAGLAQKRRDVILRYYFDNPLLLRIGVLLCGAALALLVALYVPPSAPQTVRAIPQILLGINILAGEAWIGRWRSARDTQLGEILHAEEIAASQAARQKPPAA